MCETHESRTIQKANEEDIFDCIIKIHERELIVREREKQKGKKIAKKMSNKYIQLLNEAQNDRMQF